MNYKLGIKKRKKAKKETCSTLVLVVTVVNVWLLVKCVDIDLHTSISRRNHFDIPKGKKLKEKRKIQLQENLLKKNIAIVIFLIVMAYNYSFI